jgi:putative DNA primase/helicase
VDDQGDRQNYEDIVPRPSGAAAGTDVRHYRVTFGSSASQKAPWSDVRSFAWPELCDLLTRHETGAKEGSCIVPAVCRAGRRKKLDAERIEIAMLDSDAGATLEQIATALSGLGWAAVVSSTHSHLGTLTIAKRGNWDRFRTAHPDLPNPAQAFLEAERSYLPGIADGARVTVETDEQVTFEHQPCPRFRVVLPLLRPWVASSYESQATANQAWKERVTALAQALGLRHDQSCTDTSRLFYLPRRPADGPPPETLVLEGQPCDLFSLPKVATAPRASAQGNRKARVSRAKAETSGPFGIDFGRITVTDPDTGEIFDLTAWAAGSARHFQIVAALRARSPHILLGKVADGTKHHIRCPNEAAHTQAGADSATFIVNASESTSSGFVIHCRHAHCDERDRLLFLRQMLEQGWLTVEDLQNHEYLALPAHSDTPWPDEDLTEHKVAEHFARRFADELRFCHTRGAWFVWTGSHWRQNNTRLAFHWMRRTTARLNVAASAKTLAATSKAGFVSAVERFAQADPAFAVTDADWNNDAWLLATPGGMVDLRTGRLAAADQKDLISRITAVTPSEAACCTRWMSFLEQATGGDGAVISFIQKWLGYCLTGVTREHALLFVYGPGGNGKGVLLITANGILHDYAVTAALDTFTRTKGERHTTEIAMLAGARFVMTTETEEGHAWAEARIKALTGGDPVTARFMRRDFFTFTPAFKLTISGNHKPTLRNVDDAARRRFLVLPFIHKPAVPNPHLIEELRSEWPGILRWMIDGCLAWQRDGLSPPPAVREATDAYFAEQDMLRQWVDECCDQGADLGEASGNLFGSWRSFAGGHGEDARNAKWFSTMLERQGFRRAKDCQHFRGRGFLGLRLRPPAVVQHWQETDA